MVKRPKPKTRRVGNVWGYARLQDNPNWQRAQQLKGLLEGDPRCAAGPVRTLDDMTEAEIAALEARYGAPVRRPGRVP
jgi:hypothetical protein